MSRSPIFQRLRTLKYGRRLVCLGDGRLECLFRSSCSSPKLAGNRKGLKLTHFPKSSSLTNTLGAQAASKFHREIRGQEIVICKCFRGLEMLEIAGGILIALLIVYLVYGAGKLYRLATSWICVFGRRLAILAIIFLR